MKIFKTDYFGNYFNKDKSVGRNTMHKKILKLDVELAQLKFTYITA